MSLARVEIGCSQIRRQSERARSHEHTRARYSGHLQQDGNYQRLRWSIDSSGFLPRLSDDERLSGAGWPMATTPIGM